MPIVCNTDQTNFIEEVKQKNKYILMNFVYIYIKCSQLGPKP